VNQRWSAIPYELKTSKTEKAMSAIQSRPIIGIDRGASFSDFCVVKSGHLVDTMSIEKRDWESITDLCDRLLTTYKTEHVVFTGSAAHMPARLKKKIQIIPEIDAIGFGGATAADHSECIVACMGTGTAIVHFKDKISKHVGGTGVGGGTIKGLASLLFNIEDPLKVESLAMRGETSQTNLTISDLGYESVSFLGADMTASNFAAVKSRKIEDLAAGILSLVAETVGIIASICGREAGCPDKIVMVGKTAQSQFIRNILNRVGKLYNTTFIFPNNPGYATVYGAAMKYQHDLKS
jgi:type II pantothenate kinase